MTSNTINDQQKLVIDGNDNPPSNQSATNLGRIYLFFSIKCQNYLFI